MSLQLQKNAASVIAASASGRFVPQSRHSATLHLSTKRDLSRVAKPMTLGYAGPPLTLVFINEETAQNAFVGKWIGRFWPRRPASKSFDDEAFIYLVANLNTADGSELASRYCLPSIALLLFGPQGEMVQIVRGPNDTASLQVSNPCIRQLCFR